MITLVFNDMKVELQRFISRKIDPYTTKNLVQYPRVLYYIQQLDHPYFSLIMDN